MRDSLPLLSLKGWIEEYDNKNPNQYQGMVRFFADGLIEPLDQFFHPSGRFKWRGGLKYHAQALAVRSEGLDVVGYLLILSAMVLILGTVFEQHAVQLLNVVFSGGDDFVALENHVHCIGIARNFLLVAAGKGLAPQAGQQLPDLRIAEFGTLYARGRPHALNRGNSPQARQLFGCKGLNNLPAPLELVDFSDELEDFRRDDDVLDVAHG